MFLVMESVNLITIGYLLVNFHKLKMAPSKMAISKMAFPFCKWVQAQICFRIFIGPAAKLLEGNKDHFRFTTRQPPRIHCRCGRRHPHVCEFATERLVH